MTTQQTVTRKKPDETDAASDPMPDSPPQQAGEEITAITPLTLLKGAQSAGADVTTIEKYMDLYERWEDRKAKQAFDEAMARVQARIPVVAAESLNTQTNSRYAKEWAISKAIKPIYTEEGFSLSFNQGECPLEQHMRILCDVSHSGHTVRHHIDLPYDLAGIKGTVNKTPIHAYKSTFTYGRGILICAIFGVATGVGDDDGNSASGGEPIHYLTEAEQDIIRDMLQVHGANKEGFMQWLGKQGWPSLDKIPQDKLEWVKQSIVASCKNKQRGKGAKNENHS